MKPILTLVVLCLLLSCNKTPEPINYGADMCHYCQMTIVTKTHASQLVTSKGKQYKFDAIECMIQFLGDQPELAPNSNLLVANYEAPGTMIQAKTAHYAVCEDIKSPMGAYLSGFESLEAAKKVIADRPADFFDWEGIFKHLN